MNLRPIQALDFQDYLLTYYTHLCSSPLPEGGTIAFFKHNVLPKVWISYKQKTGEITVVVPDKRECAHVSIEHTWIVENIRDVYSDYIIDLHVSESDRPEIPTGALLNPGATING